MENVGENPRKETRKLSDFVESNVENVGEWVKLSEDLTGGFKSCNFTFHTWKRYASKEVQKSSFEVGKWALRKYVINDVHEDDDLFRWYADGFLQAFGKKRSLLMIG